MLDASWAGEVRKEEQEITNYVDTIATAFAEQQEIVSSKRSEAVPDMKSYEVSATKVCGWTLRALSPAPTSILPTVLLMEDTTGRCFVVPLRGCTAPSQDIASRNKIDLQSPRFVLAQHSIDGKVRQFPMLVAHPNKISLNTRQLFSSFPEFQMNRK